MTASTPAPQKDQKSAPARRRLFSPILAGATLKERLIACLGALIGIGLTGVITGFVMGDMAHAPLIVAPMGASAVLLFAVPASPMSQPWPIIGGNAISALIGVAAMSFFSNPAIAAGVAVSFAILAMSVTRSLHPPGGAAALTAVIGGAAVMKAGFWFPFVPVALNAAILVGLGVVFHRLSGRSYPHRAPAAAPNTHKTADPPPALRAGFTSADIDAALATMHETLDVGSDDIGALLREVEQHALRRQTSDLTCADIMSRDVVTVRSDATCGEAEALLLKHNVRILPVVGGDGLLKGTVGLRDLAGRRGSDELPISPAVTARPSEPAFSLQPHLTDGSTHAVVILAEESRVAGIVSQTDLLSALARSLVRRPGLALAS